MFDRIKKIIMENKILMFWRLRDNYGNLVPNVNLDLLQPQKRVLFIYLDYYEANQQVLKASEKKNSGALHTNRREFFQIIHILIKQNFCVDICAHDDIEAIKYIKQQEYDYILGLGKVYEWAVENKDAYKVLYMTENPYHISYLKEKERLDYYYMRYHRKLPFVRTGRFFGKDIEKKVDAIICLGDARYYDDAKRIERIYPSAFYNAGFDITQVKRKKNYFLVFGTDGFIHKGIDLLVDIFAKHPEWELFLCGYQLTATIKKMMKIDITNTNIHDCGYITIDSMTFLDLVNICQFILLPSCSEATSTAILTGMRHGLIPVVMHENGFDEFESMCFFWDEYHLKNMEDKILELTKMNDNDLEERELKVYKFANRNFTLDKFTDRFQRAVERLLV